MASWQGCLEVACWLSSSKGSVVLDAAKAGHQVPARAHTILPQEVVVTVLAVTAVEAAAVDSELVSGCYKSCPISKAINFGIWQ